MGPTPRALIQAMVACMRPEPMNRSGEVPVGPQSHPLSGTRGQAALASMRDGTCHALLAVLSCTLALAACGAQPDAAEAVALAEVASRSDAYDGQMLSLRGRVQGYHDPRHYWLEDGQRNRVGLAPAERIAPHLGREVTVVGHYHYSRERGRWLTIHAIEPYDARR